MSNLFHSKILGTGSYVPSKVLTNHDLEKMVDTSDQWITERTGIKERRIVSGDECGTDLALKASQKALEAANLKPDDIDFIIYATVTPDYKLPSSSAILQNKLGLTNECPCMDLVAACSGFVYAMVTADSFIKTGMYKNILLVGSETLSSYTDWQDRTTCVLFSDGAGAAVIGRAESKDESRVLSSVLTCDGSGKELLTINSGGTANPDTHQSIEMRKNFIKMEGRNVFKYATRTMINNALEILSQANIARDQLDWFIPHQANLRIIEYLAKKLEVDLNKIIVTVEKYGNNSSATIPIALDEAIRDGRIQRGQLIAFDAFGAGITSGACLIKY